MCLSSLSPSRTGRGDMRQSAWPWTRDVPLRGPVQLKSPSAQNLPPPVCQGCCGPRSHRVIAWQRVPCQPCVREPVLLRTRSPGGDNWVSLAYSDIDRVLWSLSRHPIFVTMTDRHGQYGLRWFAARRLP